MEAAGNKEIQTASALLPSWQSICALGKAILFKARWMRLELYHFFFFLLPHLISHALLAFTEQQQQQFPQTLLLKNPQNSLFLSPSVMRHFLLWRKKKIFFKCIWCKQYFDFTSFFLDWSCKEGKKMAWLFIYFFFSDGFFFSEQMKPSQCKDQFKLKVKLHFKLSENINI